MAKTEETLRECSRWICHSFDILKAIIIRFCFALHATIAIIRIVIIKGDYWYLLNMCGVNFLLIELVVTIIKRKGKEPKWFSPCFFLYICTMIPPIWFLEIDRINMKLGRVPVNQTDTEIWREMFEKGLISQATFNEKTIREWGVEDAMMIELSFMFVILLGRWLLPKGNISHSALSQLLLVYLSLASDILDILTLFNEQEIYFSSSMVHLILLVFSLCMFQFALNLTATRGRSFHAEFDETEFEIHQSAPTRPPPALIPKSNSAHQRLFAKLIPSSSTARPLATTTFINPDSQVRPRASTINVVQPPDTIFENVDATEEFELKVKPTIAVTSKPLFPPVDPPRINILHAPDSARPSISSLNSLHSSFWNTPRIRAPSRKSISESVKFFVKKRSGKLLRSEIWSILVTLAMQDGPFLAIRLTAIFVYHVRSFLTYFFTFKNCLILLFQTYRIVSICLEKDDQEQEIEEKLNTIRRMSRAATQLGVPLDRKI